MNSNQIKVRSLPALVPISLLLNLDIVLSPFHAPSLLAPIDRSFSIELSAPNGRYKLSQAPKSGAASMSSCLQLHRLQATSVRIAGGFVLGKTETTASSEA